MSVKRVVLRDRAHRDLEKAVDYYVREAGASVALRFVNAVESTFGAIGGRPAAGSPRYAYELNLPGLRARSVRQFPYLIFYIEREEHIDVWRVLHAQSDIPAWMQGPSDP